MTVSPVAAKMRRMTKSWIILHVPGEPATKTVGGWMRRDDELRMCCE